MKTKTFHYFALCLLLAPFSFTHAQKVKTEAVKASLIHYPIVALPASYNTYRVMVENQGLDVQEFKIVSPEEKIHMYSLKKIKDGADFNIKIILGKLKLFQSNSATPIKSLDELKGYSSEEFIDYKISISYEITDKSGITIQKEVLTQTHDFSTEGQLPTEPALRSKAVDIVKSVTNYTDTGVDKINARIRDLFDMYREDYPIDFYTVKPSKTQTYEEFSTAVKRVDDALKNPTDESSMRSAIQPSIDFWEKNLATLDMTSEEGKPHYFLCGFNLAVTYLILDDLDKSTQYLEKTKASNYRPGYVTLFGYDLTKRKKYKDQYIADQAKTENDATLVYQKGESPKKSPDILDLGKKQPVAESDFMGKGFIIMAGTEDTLFGNFIEFDKNFQQGKLLFVENGKTQKEYRHPYTELHQASTQGIVYYSAKGLRKAIYASPSLAVMGSGLEIVFSFTGKVTTYNSYDPEDGASYLTNYKKKLAEAFKEECTYVAEKSLRGEYDLKQAGTKSLDIPIKDYETQCGSKEYEKYAALLDPTSIQRLYR